MPEIQVGQLSPSEPASKQHRKDCSVSPALKRIRVRRLQQPASLFSSKPISEPHTQFLDAFHTANASGQLRTEQAGVSGFISETPNRSESSIDGPGGKLPGFKMNTVSGDHRLVERESRFGTVPMYELIDCLSIPSLRLGRTKTVKDGRSAVIQVRKSELCFRPV